MAAPIRLERELPVSGQAAGFAVVGALVALVGIKMFLMLRIPATIVEVDRMPVRLGESFSVTVRQPGPVRLRSLRVSLVCEPTTRRPGTSKTNRDRRIIHQTNVLDVRDATAGSGDEIVREGAVSLPTRVPIAEEPGPKAFVWRLEVWGRVRGWADFGHPFVIDVVDDSPESDATDGPSA